MTFQTRSAYATLLPLPIFVFWGAASDARIDDEVHAHFPDS